MSKNFNAEKRNLYRVRTKMVGASVVLVFFIALISCVAIQFFDNKKMHKILVRSWFRN